MVKKSPKVIKIPFGALRPFALGNALGSISVFTLLLYAVMTWFGGFSETIVTSQYPLVFSFNSWTILLGLIQSYVLGYIAGWIIAKLYNRSLLQ